LYGPDSKLRAPRGIVLLFMELGVNQLKASKKWSVVYNRIKAL
jgi:hypothetical protein